VDILTTAWSRDSHSEDIIRQLSPRGALKLYREWVGLRSYLADKTACRRCLTVSTKYGRRQTPS